MPPRFTVYISLLTSVRRRMSLSIMEAYPWKVWPRRMGTASCSCVRPILITSTKRLSGCFRKMRGLRSRKLRRKSIFLLRLYQPGSAVLKKKEPYQKKEFYPFIQSVPNVIECNCVTGEYSMVLEVLFPSTTELDKFIGELQRFGRTKTLIVFSTSVEHRGINADDIEETLE